MSIILETMNLNNINIVKEELSSYSQIWTLYKNGESIGCMRFSIINPKKQIDSESIGYKYTNEEYIYIKDINIDKRYRRLGLCKKLIFSLINDYQYLDIYLEVISYEDSNFLDKLMKIYENIGFVKLGMATDMVYY